MVNALQKVQFKHAGVNSAGETVYDLWIDGAPVARGLTIERVVERIASAEEPTADRSPAPIRTPEDHLPSWQRRECPKAL